MKKKFRTHRFIPINVEIDIVVKYNTALSPSVPSEGIS
jgi:hypothetical protein